MITYRKTQFGSIKVQLDGKYVGSILQDGQRWFYRPNNSTVCGESFPNIAGVKRSLEQEASWNDQSSILRHG